MLRVMIINMKSKRIFLLLLFSMIFLIGVLAGAVIQKTIGVGNILRAVGIPYPTSVPPGDPYVLSTAEIPQAYRGQMSLFILAGQSNMVGAAPVSEYEKTNPRIYVFGNDYRWRIASEPIDNPHDQVDKVSEDRPAGFSPSLAFALANLNRQPQIVIGLIPCAKSSSSILEWQRNLSDQSLYGSCLKRVRAASPMGQIAGVLFFQGESDAQDPIQYPTPEANPFDWAKLFTTFITYLRTDLNQPNLPVVFAQLGSNTAPEVFINWEVVRHQQASIQLPMTAMIVTDDLPLLDGLHFTTQSYKIIGERFSEAYWDLVQLQNSNE